MVMRESTQQGYVLRFHVPDLGRNALLVDNVVGREALSHPYHFELGLVSTQADLDPTRLMQQRVTLIVKQGIPIRGSTKRGVRDLLIHGVLASFEQCGKSGDWVSYRAELVPHLRDLSLNRASRIFMGKTVPEIVAEVLKLDGFTDEDYELKLGGRSYTKREYVVQYQESDLDFLSRWLEHEGIFYYFRQEEAGEKIVFADSPGGYDLISGEDRFPYRPKMAGAGQTAPLAAGTDAWFDTESVWDFRGRQNRTAGKVVLRDYNWRTPGVDLKATTSVEEYGIGEVCEYGEHYKTPEEGAQLAALRSEELRCRERYFTGSSDARSFRAGSTFELTDCYRAGFNDRYVVTEATHYLDQALLLGSAGAQGGSYRNEFVCLPASVPFRPERITPKPRILATINGRIDASGDGKYAEIDDQGRYKVVLPFDPSGKDNGTASRWIRMAQPYGGPNYGHHFPLHKGTEVLITHIDGDPDRPVIVGVLPNPNNVSPVVGENQTQSIIRTAASNEIVIEDQEECQYVRVRSPKLESFFHLGAKHPEVSTMPGATLSTQGAVSVSAQGGITMVAGKSMHNDSIKMTEKAMGVAATISSTAAIIASAAVGSPIQKLASLGPVGWAGLVAGLADGAVAAGDKYPWNGITLCSPGGITAMSLQGVSIGAVLNMNQVCVGQINIMSGLGTLVSGGLSAAMVAGGPVDVISVFGNTRVWSKRKDLSLLAKLNIEMAADLRDVKIQAKKKSVAIVAHRHLLARTEKGKADVLIHKKLHVESLDAKKIELKAGESSLLLENKRVTIKSPQIVLQSAPDYKAKKGKARLQLDEKGSKLVGSSEGMIGFFSKKNLVHVADKAVALHGKKVVQVKTPKLDERKAKEIVRAKSREK